MGNKLCNCNDYCLNKKSQNLSKFIINNGNNNNFFNYKNTFGSNEENFNNLKFNNENRIKEIYYLNCIKKIIKCYKNYKYRKDNNLIIKAKLRKFQKEKKINNYINNIIKNSNNNNNNFNENNIEKNKLSNYSSTKFLNIPSLNLNKKLFSNVNSIKNENFNKNKSFVFYNSSLRKDNNNFKISLYKNKSLTNRKNEVNNYLSKKHNFSLLKDFEDSN